jgi:hypothetical protein
MEIINPYCALIAPAACACDANPITSIGIEHCVFFKIQTCIVRLDVSVHFDLDPSLDRWGYVCHQEAFHLGFRPPDGEGYITCQYAIDY